MLFLAAGGVVVRRAYFGACASHSLPIRVIRVMTTFGRPERDDAAKPSGLEGLTTRIARMAANPTEAHRAPVQLLERID